MLLCFQVDPLVTVILPVLQRWLRINVLKIHRSVQNSATHVMKAQNAEVIILQCKCCTKLCLWLIFAGAPPLTCRQLPRCVGCPAHTPDTLISRFSFPSSHQNISTYQIRHSTLTTCYESQRNTRILLVYHRTCLQSNQFLKWTFQSDSQDLRVAELKRTRSREKEDSSFCYSQISLKDDTNTKGTRQTVTSAGPWHVPMFDFTESKGHLHLCEQARTWSSL